MKRVRHVVAGLAVGIGAVAVGNAASAASHPRVATSEVSDVQSVGAPSAFDDLRDVVAQFESSGEITFAGARRLEVCLVFAEHNVERGTPSGAILALEQFKAIASQPRYVPSESARTVLIAAADELIGELSSARLM